MTTPLSTHSDKILHKRWPSSTTHRMVFTIFIKCVCQNMKNGATVNLKTYLRPNGVRFGFETLSFFTFVEAKSICFLYVCVSLHIWNSQGENLPQGWKD